MSAVLGHVDLGITTDTSSHSFLLFLDPQSLFYHAYDTGLEDQLSFIFTSFCNSSRSGSLLLFYRPFMDINMSWFSTSSPNDSPTRISNPGDQHALTYQGHIKRRLDDTNTHTLIRCG